MKSIGFVITLFSCFACTAKLTTTYAKVIIYGDKQELADLNKLGLPLDHITLYRDSAVVGYFSYYDVRQVKRNGFSYKILERNVGKNFKADQ